MSTLLSIDNPYIIVYNRQMDNVNLILGVIGTGMGLLLTIWRFAIWIQNQFSSLKDQIHKSVSDLEAKVLNKLEYHEKHDDRRFSEVHNEIWEIKVLNAAKQGMIANPRKVKSEL